MKIIFSFITILYFILISSCISGNSDNYGVPENRYQRGFTQPTQVAPDYYYQTAPTNPNYPAYLSNPNHYYPPNYYQPYPNPRGPYYQHYETDGYYAPPNDRVDADGHLGPY